MALKTKPEQLATDDAKLEGFRSHNAEGPKEVVMTRASGRDARISKTVRMRLRFGEMLRDESYRRTRETGQKVSEADLLDEALLDWKLKHNIFSD